MKNLRRNNSGSIIIMMALALAVLAFFAFGGLQLASTARNASSLQQNADAAALAGAREMFRNLESENTAVIEQKVTDYVNANFVKDGTNTGNVSIATNVDWGTLRVQVRLGGTTTPNANITKPLAGQVNAEATAELVFPDVDWCVGIDLSTELATNPTNSAFLGSSNSAVRGNSGDIVRELIAWINNINKNNTYKKKISYAVAPYGNSVNVGVYNMDAIMSPRSDGLSHEDEMTKGPIYIDRKYDTFAASCNGCVPPSCSPNCLSAPGCWKGASPGCWEDFLTLYQQGKFGIDKGKSIGCTKERLLSDNYSNDASPQVERFTPMITFFETGCSSGHMFCLPPALPLMRPGDALYGQLPDMQPVKMWNVDSSSVGGSPIQFDQKPIFVEGLAWCHRLVSPKWDGVWTGYSALPDYKSWSGKGVHPNFGQPGGKVAIDDERKKIISLFAAGFVDQVNPDKVQVALSLLDATAYSEHPKASQLVEVTKDACTKIKQVQYKGEGIAVFVVNSNPRLLPHQVEILKGCASTEEHYQELFDISVSTAKFKDIMLNQLDKIVYTRLVR